MPVSVRQKKVAGHFQNDGGSIEKSVSDCTPLERAYAQHSNGPCTFLLLVASVWKQRHCHSPTTHCVLSPTCWLTVHRRNSRNPIRFVTRERNGECSIIGALQRHTYKYIILFLGFIWSFCLRVILVYWFRSPVASYSRGTTKTPCMESKTSCHSSS